ncbi:Armadillo-like helical [Penicillium cosmopolitanum]|uniref:Importin-95 n=1 Tax=Penicillium cosmopolitanum TaxID=1131564 RepID=A0A9X0B551_9EURO|nr:Armadillo-like helical [Penicillium cosmopolitanum]XP_057122296.1 Armadillo-like helical [Penicillium waksmanii]KAJ5388503.1 Armadillo-like helical [Penicillium cosmopolitanum]KAJ5983258.1 Armadillo-like helical [Penicillium waksmanii]
MDARQVLQSTLAPDAAERTNAEQQLAHAAEVDFAAYLITLGQELANDESPAHIRVAAGIALKNAFTFRDQAKLREVQQRWIQQINPETKTQVKELALKTLHSTNTQSGNAAATLIVSIAAIELPRKEWPDLMNILVQNVASGSDSLKQSSLTTIGYICDSQDTELRESLIEHSNAILTAVVQGARREEPNMEVRFAAINALSDAVDFVRSNMDNEGERNYIMQVVCEATQADEVRVQAGAFGCLNRIMGAYYEKMRFYMEKALFGLSIMGMKSEEEEVSKLAIEFWCTVCEEEIAIEDDNAEAAQEGVEARPFFGFARVATREVLPVLLQAMCRQDEDATDEEYNVSRAAYQALQLYAQCVQGDVIQPVVAFVEENIRNEDWHYRDAAVAAFGGIMEGPEPRVLEPLIKQALPVLLGMMEDNSVSVRDSTAYALGRVCDCCPEVLDPEVHLQPLISCLFNGLASSPKIASSCCWALMNVADRFAGDAGSQTNPLSKHFEESVKSLLTVTERQDADNQLRTAGYEVLNSFVLNSANDSLAMVATLSDVILQRLEQTIPMQQQVVSAEDRMLLEEMQTSLISVILAIVQRFETDIKPQADRIMTVLLQVLQTVGAKSSVPDVIFATVGAIASAMEEDFVKYMEQFSPFLYNALGNQEEPALCAMAIGLVSDIARAMNDKVQPYCDHFMNLLLGILRTATNQLKPAILETFGDIAQAIGTQFDTYLTVVGGVLQQASSVTTSSDLPYDMVDYIVSLREGIMDAWGGILLSYKGTPSITQLQPFIESIFQLLHIISQEGNRSEGLMRSSMGVLGDLADSFPNGELAHYFRNDWVTALVRETRTTRQYSPRTIETARWTREQVKRQINLGAGMS